MSTTWRHQMAFLGAVACLCVSGQTLVDLAKQGRNADFSQQPATRPVTVGTSLPATCQVGAFFFKSDAAAGLNLFGCTAPNVWTVVGPVTTVFGRSGAITKQAGDYLFSDIGGVAALSQGGTGATTAASARTNLGAAATSHSHVVTDLSGVTGLQGSGSKLQSFGGGTVQSGHCAQFDAGGSLVSAGTPCSAGAANFGVSFSGQTTVALAHGLNTRNVIVQCYDGADQALGYNTLQISDANTAVVTFLNAQAGRCVVNGAGGGGVSTVFGRAGAVLAQAGDYQFSQIGGQLGVSQILAADRQGSGSKLQMFGGGSVSTGHCAQFDGSGNLVSSGAGCGGAYSAGPGVAIVGGAIAVDSASVPTYLTMTASLVDWNDGADNVPGQSCREKSFAFPGAMTTDGVAPRWPTTLPLQLMGMVYVNAPNTVVVRLCNPTTASVTVFDGLSFGATIVRSF